MISHYLGIIHPLFPVPSSSVKTGFTTSISAGDKLPHIQILPLLDEVLGVHRVNNRTTHQLTVPPSADDDHAQAWEAFFPEGCINPGNKVAPMGGFGFFMKGPNDFATELGKATSTHVLFSYEVLFESEWEWRKGGKLPGICTYFLSDCSHRFSLSLVGGAGDAAYTCTGGRQSDGKCFNLRLMWR